MRLQLVSIPTDTEPLDGIYFEPEDRPVRSAALIMHGNQGNFYTGPPRFLPPHLAELGIASLAFNRRGHDILGTHLGRAPVGGALQLSAQAIEDNNRAAAFLAEKGFGAPILIGHSNGGLLAGQHAADHPETPALVLLSAAGGGLESTRVNSRVGLMLGDRYEELAREAEALVASGRGDTLMLIPGWWWVISAASLHDRLHHLPDLVECAPRINCPSLFLKGVAEAEAAYPARAFQAASRGECQLVELEDCDHWYRGREDAVAQQVTSWLAATLAGPVAR